MSISTRDRRVSVYPYGTANDGGYTTSVYGPKRGTYFCRVSPAVGLELTESEQADHRERCVFEFADSVTVGLNDLLIDPSAVQWKVESATPRRNNGNRALVVRAVRSTDESAVVPV